MSVDRATTADGGVSNFSVGSFTGAGEALEVTLGFKPRYIKVINLTDRIVWEQTYDMAATHTLKTVADGTMTDDTGSALVPKGGDDSYRGFLASATVAANGKVLHYFAFG